MSAQASGLGYGSYKQRQDWRIGPVCRVLDSLRIDSVLYIAWAFNRYTVYSSV